MRSSSDRLRNNISRIISLWEQRAVQEIGSSSSVTPVALKNEITRFLSQVADALSKTIEKTEFRLREDKLQSILYAKAHGAIRAESAVYSLADVIQEFHVLREVIFEVVEEQDPLSPDERNLILSMVQMAVKDAAAQFADTQRQRQEEFAMTLAHDLRNPITAAKTFASVALKARHDDKIVEHALNKVNEKMDQVSAMLRELLDVGRFRAGQGLVIDEKEMRLDELVHKVLEEMSQVHGNRFVIVTPTPVIGRWNWDGLRRIIENLVVNALKYGSHDKPITVTATQNDGNATLIVHNEGNPIPPDEQSKLFIKFRRSSTTGTKTGWGLGLALVLAMTEAHHGKVRVDSTAEKGTSFIVDIPKAG